MARSAPHRARRMMHLQLDGSPTFLLVDVVVEVFVVVRPSEKQLRRALWVPRRDRDRGSGQASPLAGGSGGCRVGIEVEQQPHRLQRPWDPDSSARGSRS